MKTLSLSQESYIDSILDYFGMSNSRPSSVPMDPSITLSSADSLKTLEKAVDMAKVPYQEAIGALLYLAVATRPNIAFAITLLAWFSNNPGCAHWDTVKKVF